MGRVLQKLRSVDFYRKIPADLTEATLYGALISVLAALVITLLIGAELTSYMQREMVSNMVVDRSPMGDLLRINFNVSFPSLSCEYATLDVSDALGMVGRQKRLNLTKTVRKVPITEDLSRSGFHVEDKGDQRVQPKYDTEHPGEQYEDVQLAIALSQANWAETMKRYDIVVVNFFAPWCPWCQRLGPTWEAATEEVHMRYPETDGRIRFAKVDCTVEVDLCRDQAVTAFPSVRVYRHGSDDVVRNGHHDHESYNGDRTKEALVKFADELASAVSPHAYVKGVQKVNKSPGCNFSGFVLVKKVPGTLHFVARAPGHSFDYLSMNMSHYIHHFYYGNRPSPRRYKALNNLHPLGLTEDWSDKLRDQAYMSDARGATFEHYIQVVLTSIEPKNKPDLQFDAYEYTVQSHTYVSEESAAGKFSYTMSPIQIVVTERPKPLFHFLVSICAVVGGVFTVAGILDSILYQVDNKILRKKLDLGKQG